MIGGLRGSRTTENLSKVPLLGDLPLIGALFRSTSQTRTRTELLIVLFPRVLTPAWIDEDVERGIERTVAARVPYERLTMGMEERVDDWRDFALAGQPSRGDLGTPTAPPADTAHATKKGISRGGLARLGFARALRALASQDEAQANYELSQALQLDERLAQAWLLRGTLERRRNGNSAARAAYERSIALDDGTGHGLNNLGLIELNAGNPIAAEGLFRRALARAGDGFAAGHNNLGVARLQQGDAAAARAEFTKALAADADLREAHANLGVALDLLGDVAAAAESYRRFLLAGGDINDPRLRALQARISTLANGGAGPSR